jgi:hypothetical protein
MPDTFAEIAKTRSLLWKLEGIERIEFLRTGSQSGGRANA